MPDDDISRLTPADRDGLHFTLRHALLHNGKKRFDSAREVMANITADHLLNALDLSGYVVMKKPPGPSPSIGSSPGWPGPKK